MFDIWWTIDSNLFVFPFNGIHFKEERICQISTIWVIRCGCKEWFMHLLQVKLLGRAKKWSKYCNIEREKYQLWMIRRFWPKATKLFRQWNAIFHNIAPCSCDKSSLRGTSGCLHHQHFSHLGLPEKFWGETQILFRKHYHPRIPIKIAKPWQTHMIECWVYIYLRCICKCIYICMCIYKCVYLYMYVYIYKRIYLYMYIVYTDGYIHLHFGTIRTLTMVPDGLACCSNEIIAPLQRWGFCGFPSGWLQHLFGLQFQTCLFPSLGGMMSHDFHFACGGWKHQWGSWCLFAQLISTYIHLYPLISICLSEVLFHGCPPFVPKFPVIVFLVDPCFPASRKRSRMWKR